MSLLGRLLITLAFECASVCLPSLRSISHANDTFHGKWKTMCECVPDGMQRLEEGQGLHVVLGLSLC